MDEKKGLVDKKYHSLIYPNMHLQSIWNSSKKFRKKGQVTIFLIIGVIIAILAYFLIVFAFTHQNNPPDTFTSTIEFQTAQNILEGCTHQLTIDSVGVIVDQGGYYHLPDLSTTEYVAETAYHYANGKIMVPSITTVEGEISQYIADHLANCVNETNSLQQNVIVKMDDLPEVAVHISQSRITVKANTRIIMAKEGNEDTLPELQDSLDGPRILDMITASKAIAEQQQLNPVSICTSCIEKIATTFGFEVEFMRAEKGIVFYHIIDRKNLIDDQPITFVFAHRNEVAA